MYCSCSLGGGVVGSMVNHMFSLSPLVVSLTYIPHYLYGVLIGLILGDGFLTLSQGRRNACFRFQVPQVQAVARPLLFAGNIRPAKRGPGQGQINAGFFWHVWVSDRKSTRLNS